MAIFLRNRIFRAAIESTYGSDAAPAAETGILLKEPVLTPMEGQDLDRDLELPYFGQQGTVPIDVHSKLSFKVELAPSGTPGVAPGWGILLRACGVAETIVPDTSVTYNPITDDAESVSIHIFIGNTRHVILGARGTATFEMSASSIPYIMFEFTGLFTLPSEQVRVLPNLDNWQPPQEVTPAFSELTIAGNAGLTIRKFMMNMGNQVEPRFLIGPQEILITEKSEQIELTMQAVPLTTFDPYALAFNQSEVAISMRHGVGAGRIFTFATPRAQMQRPQGLESPQNIVEWPLRLVPRTNLGNDQWTLTLT